MPLESHLINSPSNGNGSEATSQIIRHFRRRAWFSNKPSSQQTHRCLTALEVLRGDGEAREDQLCRKPSEKASQLMSEDEKYSSSQQMFYR